MVFQEGSQAEPTLTSLKYKCVPLSRRLAQPWGLGWEKEVLPKLQGGGGGELNMDFRLSLVCPNK